MKEDVSPEEVSPEELRQCLGAISRYHEGASEVRLPPGEVYGHTSPGGRYVYINFVRPSDIPVGSIYRTWVVRLEGGGGPGGVSYFRSRRGAAGDDTLPPDD
ncbi:MAG TPA: hypothetical protein VD968_15270 [Pyrinomonadaceae bacterium]|nr:hypothetical protein [Pyrinomonadaceae bacterium]